MTNTDVLTLDHLHEAFGDNDAGIANVLTMAVTDGLERMLALTEAIASGDDARALELAHTLKGTAGNLGAFEIAGHAAALERALRKNSRDEVSECHDALAASFERFENAVERYQAGR